MSQRRWLRLVYICDEELNLRFVLTKYHSVYLRAGKVSP